METVLKPDVPYHLPVTLWSRNQLCKVIKPEGGKPTRAELEAILAEAGDNSIAATQKPQDAVSRSSGSQVAQ